MGPLHSAHHPSTPPPSWETRDANRGLCHASVSSSRYASAIARDDDPRRLPFTWGGVSYLPSNEGPRTKCEDFARTYKRLLSDGSAVACRSFWDDDRPWTVVTEDLPSSKRSPQHTRLTRHPVRQSGLGAERRIAGGGSNPGGAQKSPPGKEPNAYSTPLDPCAWGGAGGKGIRES